jgi:hypothetical protein
MFLARLSVAGNNRIFSFFHPAAHLGFSQQQAKVSTKFQIRYILIASWTLRRLKGL